MNYIPLTEGFVYKVSLNSPLRQSMKNLITIMSQGIEYDKQVKSLFKKFIDIVNERHVTDKNVLFHAHMFIIKTDGRADHVHFYLKDQKLIYYKSLEYGTYKSAEWWSI